jgi:hypothetical protein
MADAGDLDRGAVVILDLAPAGDVGRAGDGER